MVITTKIKELQYYTKFNEVFVLSLLILFTNLGGERASGGAEKENEINRKIQKNQINKNKKIKGRICMRFRKKETKTKRRTGQTAVLALAAAAALSGMTLTGCSQPGGQKDEEVVIYSNADDEAVEAMKKTWIRMGMRENISSRPLAPPSWAAR